MKKFTNNDIFHNILLANTEYVIVMHSGSLRINDQINQNQEASSSISGIEFETTYSFNKYTGSYSYNQTITRELISKNPFTGNWDYPYTRYSSLKKVAALKNIFPDHVAQNEFSDIKYYLLNNGLPNHKASDITNFPPPASFITTASNVTNFYILPAAPINMIEIPRDFYGSYINQGSLRLNVYVSGVLCAAAQDTDKTGKIIQTYGSGSGRVIGSVFYEQGIILITGSEQINISTQPYIQPLDEFSDSFPSLSDYFRWVYFGSYLNTTGSRISTKYELIFEGSNFIPTTTLLCHAEKNELFWSNNRTFIEAGQGDEIISGQTTSSMDKYGDQYQADSGSILIPSSKIYQENPNIQIKNTISSSFAHYSASYEPQVFISQIGIYDDDKNLIAIAKLANPVRKMKSDQFTFKLKIDG